MPPPDLPQPTLAPHRLAARITNLLGLILLAFAVLLTLISIRFYEDPPASSVHAPMGVIAAFLIFGVALACLFLAVILWLTAPGIRRGGRTSMSVARIVAIMVGALAAFVTRGADGDRRVLYFTLPVIGLCVVNVVCITRAGLTRGPSAGRGFEPVVPPPLPIPQQTASHEQSKDNAH